MVQENNEGGAPWKSLFAGAGDFNVL